jgi:uncharacterized protein YutE (UPF0331/DUF86 family)
MTDRAEREALEALRAEYEAKGFEFIVGPHASLLAGLAILGYRPDAVALSADKKIAIEIVRPNKAAIDSANVKRREALNADGWDFRVIYLSTARPSALEPLKKEELSASLEEAKTLLRGRHYRAALIVAWSTLEGMGRLAFPRRFSRPQTPATLLEGMGTEGVLLPDEVDALRPMIKLRNEVVHGGSVDVENLPAVAAALVATVERAFTRSLGA